MKQKVKEINERKPIWFFLIFNLILLLVLIILKNHLPPVIPLFYGAPAGSAELAANQAIFLPTILTATETLINLILTFKVKDEFIKKALIGSCGFLTFLSAFTTIRIILLVGNF